MEKVQYVLGYGGRCGQCWSPQQLCSMNDGVVCGDQWRHNCAVRRLRCQHGAAAALAAVEAEGVAVGGGGRRGKAGAHRTGMDVGAASPSNQHVGKKGRASPPSTSSTPPSVKRARDAIAVAEAMKLARAQERIERYDRKKYARRYRN